MTFLRNPLLAAAIAIVGAGVAAATPITTPGLTVTSGPLTFSNFTCAFTGSGTNTGACSTIDAAPMTPPPAGIVFSTNLSVTGASSADAALGFQLTSTQGISSVGLTFSSIFLGMDVNSVVETVYNGSIAGGVVGQVTVFGCGTTAGCGSTLSSTVNLGGSFTNLYITKDINLAGNAAGSFGSTSIIDQTFNTVTTTPEPLSMSLIGAGLAFIGLARARKTRKS